MLYSKSIVLPKPHRPSGECSWFRQGRDFLRPLPAPEPPLSRYGGRHPRGQENTAASWRQIILSPTDWRSEEHTSELQSLMRISYAVFCLKKKKKNKHNQN